jgi:signal transduction histidine kinase
MSWESEDRAEFLKIIDDEADRLRELIDNLLDSSRLESGSLGMTREPTKVASLFRDTVSRARSMYPDLELKTDIDDTLPIVELDATRISQVLDNLISNAEKYAPDSTITIRATTEDDHLQVEVADGGPGIAPEHKAHLFERFYRVPDKSSTRGTGLGLYICRKIIEAHDGEIGVDSEVGKGTRFHFHIPLTSAMVNGQLEKN